jgi:hypothetical protein
LATLVLWLRTWSSLNSRIERRCMLTILLLPVSHGGLITLFPLHWRRSFLDWSRRALCSCRCFLSYLLLHVLPHNLVTGLVAIIFAAQLLLLFQPWVAITCILPLVNR